jgi:hypothetical protein
MVPRSESLTVDALTEDLYTSGRPHARSNHRVGCGTAIYALALPTCSVTSEGVMVSRPSARSTAA